MITRYSRQEMSSLWTEEAKYEAWGKVEKAHLETLVERGEAPKRVLEDFSRADKKKGPDDFLEREKETNHDVIAFIAELGDEMGDTSCYLHRGLTSSDVLDTSLAIRMKDSLQQLLNTLNCVRKSFANQAFQHALTPCIGRTHGIHAEPMSFGAVLSNHFAEFQRAHLELLEAYTHIGYGKLSGAVGSYTQLTPDFEASVLAKLGLTVEPVATQVIPRDRHLRVGNAIQSLANATERFAINMRHWARSELGEVLEPFSKKQKGSSAMPHKKNPILAENLTGLARTLKGYVSMLTQNVALWHERDISHSSTERFAFPDLFVTADFMLARLAKLVENMTIRPKAMESTLWKTGGLWASQSVLTALVKSGMPRTQAYECVQSVALPLFEQSTTTGVAPSAFQDSLRHHPEISPRLSPETIREIFSLERFLKSASMVFKRVFGVVPEEFNRKVDTPTGEKVPALHTVYKVTVELLPDVLDTEAKTINNDIKHHGLDTLALRQQKVYHIRLPMGTSTEKVKEYTEEVLHNSVIEQFKIEVVQ